MTEHEIAEIRSVAEACFNVNCTTWANRLRALQQYLVVGFIGVVQGCDIAGDGAEQPQDEQGRQQPVDEVGA